MSNLSINTILKSFIFPAFIGILLSFSANAQTKNNSSGMVEGVWQHTQSFDTAFGPGTGTTNHYISLQKNGVARQRVASMTNADWVKAVPNYQTPMFNPLVNSWIEGNDPSSLNNPNRMVLSFENISLYLIVDQDGTYTRIGNTLSISFTEKCQVAHNLGKEVKCTAETFEMVFDGDSLKLKNNQNQIYKKLTSSNSQGTTLSSRKIETNQSPTTADIKKAEPKYSGISESQELLRSKDKISEVKTGGISGYQASLLADEEKYREVNDRLDAALRTLPTYIATINSTYKDSAVKGIVLLTIKNFNEKKSFSGRMSVEIKGIKDIALNGLCTNTLEVPLKDVDTFDFGDNSKPQKFSCRIWMFPDKGVMIGGIEIFSIALKKFIVQGSFTLIELVGEK